jgi:hypothetical protein
VAFVRLSSITGLRGEAALALLLCSPLARARAAIHPFPKIAGLRAKALRPLSPVLPLRRKARVPVRPAPLAPSSQERDLATQGSLRWNEKRRSLDCARDDKT